MNKNVAEYLLKLLETDTDYSVLNEHNIRGLYWGSSASEQEIIDSIFLNLCGFTLKTILLKTGNEINNTKNKPQKIASHSRELPI